MQAKRKFFVMIGLLAIAYGALGQELRVGGFAAIPVAKFGLGPASSKSLGYSFARLGGGVSVDFTGRMSSWPKGLNFNILVGYQHNDIDTKKPGRLLRDTYLELQQTFPANLQVSPDNVTATVTSGGFDIFNAMFAPVYRYTFLNKFYVEGKVGVGALICSARPHVLRIFNSTTNTPDATNRLLGARAAGLAPLISFAYSAGVGLGYHITDEIGVSLFANFLSSNARYGSGETDEKIRLVNPGIAVFIKLQ